MTIEFQPLETADVETIRRTRMDAYGNPVEVHVSDGSVFPCRHCLGEIAAGKTYLILAHKPFQGKNPYTETGPIFLCEEPCDRAEPGDQVPPILRAETYLVRGYDREERIVYGTGQVTPTPEIAGYAQKLLLRDDIEFVDVRSAANNCYQCRIRPGS